MSLYKERFTRVCTKYVKFVQKTTKPVKVISSLSVLTTSSSNSITLTFCCSMTIQVIDKKSVIKVSLFSLVNLMNLKDTPCILPHTVEFLILLVAPKFKKKCSLEAIIFIRNNWYIAYLHDNRPARRAC